MSGRTEYLVVFVDGSTGWQAIPPGDYRLYVQRWNGRAWVTVAKVKPERRTSISGRRGLYRLYFPSQCGRPGIPSMSRVVKI